MKYFVILLVSIFSWDLITTENSFLTNIKRSTVSSGFTDAADLGFLPGATGIENAQALQRAVDKTGTIVISRPGTYKIAETVYIGSNTSLVFGNGVFIKKVDEKGTFSHVIVNKGAKTRIYDEHISITGLHIIVNGVDAIKFSEAVGLRSQLAFFYVKDLLIERFRCLDLGKLQYCIQICTFEDILINDVIIKGEKDGIHLGKGKRFKISNGVFNTFDDAVALNAHDYTTGNPELGWIEDGVVENCYDLYSEKSVGYFSRMLAGGWTDWKPGLEVQQSDAVIANGRLYRVMVNPDGKIYKSVTKPTHESGKMVLDSGITWVMVQSNVTYTVGIRNVTYRDIFLQKPRTGFSIHFDNNKYSRSYYPGAEIPTQEQIVLDNIRVLHDKPVGLLTINTPVDVLTISNSSIKNNSIFFTGVPGVSDYLKTRINITGSVFNNKGALNLVANSADGKQIILNTSSNIAIHDDFAAKVIAGNGKITVKSDLPGLNKNKKR